MEVSTNLFYYGLSILITHFIIVKRQSSRHQNAPQNKAQSAATTSGQIGPKTTGLGEPQQADFSEIPATEIFEKFASVSTLALLAV